MFSTDHMVFVYCEKCTAARWSVDSPQGGAGEARGAGEALGWVGPWQPRPPPLKVHIFIIQC